MTADTVGGVWSHALELSRELGMLGIGVVLAALGRRPSPTQARDAQAIPTLSLHAAPYRLPWMEDPWTDVDQASEWLLALAAGFECDVVHLSEPVFAALPWGVPTVAVGHSCVLSWYAAVRGEAAPPAWRRYRRRMTEGLRSSDAVVAPSMAMLGELRRLYRVRNGRVIRNGRDAARYTPGRKDDTVLTAGRLWDSGKNVLALAKVAERLTWPVQAAGDTCSPDGDETPAIHGLELLGTLGQEELASRMSRAAIFALPARYEPFGLSVLEAALSGCALVLGDIPSLRELWSGVALFVPPDDADALERAIEALIADASLRKGLAARARRRALSYGAARMATAYVELYAELLRAGRPRPASGNGAACA
ncbi:MAG TPA: glycosyltransferase [Gemmatimonadales bacterium]|nr:glycosyltransferase [Gemmatimonadales bacterium]